VENKLSPIIVCTVNKKSDNESLLPAESAFYVNEKKQFVKKSFIDKGEKLGKMEIHEIVGLDMDKLPKAESLVKNLSAAIKGRISDKDARPQIEFFKLMADYQPVPDASKTYYTLEEIEKHNTETDAWTVVNGIVYDVTKYLDYHRGGKSKLMMGAGRDCTSLFNKNHPWVSAERIIGKLQVGVLKKY